MRPQTHAAIVALGLASPFVLQFIADAPRLPLQILSGLALAAFLNRAVHVLAVLEVRARSTAAAGEMTS